jgi:hypothetical protein
MHLEALPDGRANAPEMNKTLLTRHLTYKSLSAVASCVKVAAIRIQIRSTGAKRKSVRHCRERMADVGR